MSEKRTVTTRDIAEQLNLSVSTVGRALSQDPRISQETRARVEQKAGELGYVGNLAARLMRGAPSTVVGLMVPDVRNSFYSTAAHALTQSMGEGGYQVMLSQTDDDRDAELAQLRGLAAAQVAGVILVPSPNPRPEAVRLLRDLPNVQLLRHLDSIGHHWFGVDDRGVLREATQHLVDLGHRRIAFIGGQLGFSTSNDRLSGYRDALRGEVDESLVVHAPPSSVEEARRTVGKLLDRKDPPTALVTASVRTTEGVLQELTSRGVDVPTELSVVGFGDESGFSWWGPGLTTMALPVHEVATQCSVWLQRRIRSGGIKGPYGSSSHGYLVERGSTAAQ
ncbi:LacI family DNA-binding transcriptional regulator [Streptomyces sp900129855]|jgi:LacI family transcriptional regulator|uniref:LacI family DNA-binding transcriptional regulator n=1 Tax=Streptomyces sp. 900129855 TaxID=3155129 RepID=A0ABV2ZV25_9ACTN